MWSLAFSSLRFRWLSFVGIFVTVMGAAVLVTGTGSLLEAGIRGGVPPERLAGADIVVAGEQRVSRMNGSGADRETISSTILERVRVPLGLADEVSAVPGVESVVADVSFPAELVVDGTSVTGPRGQPSLGHSWNSSSITPFDLVEGAVPDGAHDVVIDAGLAGRTGLQVGDSASAVVVGHEMELTVTGIARAVPRPLTAQSAIFFSEEAARAHYAHLGRADLLAVTTSAGADAELVGASIERLTGDGVVSLRGEDRGKAEFLDSSDASMRLIAISGSLGGIALFVAALVLAGMIALFVQQRHREIALLRAIGGTPRQVRRLLARETLTVTLLGALAGVWPGFWLATALAAAMRGKGLLPATFAAPAGVWPALAAVGAVLAVARTAAYVSGRRAGRVRPVEALADSARPRNGIGWPRAGAALLAIAGTSALFVVSMSVRASIAPALVPAMLMAAVLTVALLAPVLVTVGVRAAGVLASVLFGVSGYLAVANVRTQARRVASAAIPLALTVGVASMTLFQQATLEAESREQRADRVTAAHVITSSSAGLSPMIVEELRAQASRVVGLADTSVYAGVELDPYAAKAVMGDSVDGLLDLGVTAGSFAALGPGDVALSADAAAGLDANIGEPVELRLGNGAAVAPRLAAVYDQSLGFADVLLPWAAAGDSLTDSLLSVVLVDDGLDPGRTAAAVAAVSRRHSTAVLGGPEIIAAVEDANADTQAWVNYLLLGMVIAFSAFAVLNTLMLAIAGRRREYALLQLVGASRRQVRRMMRVEALLLVTLGWAIGAVVAAATLMPFSHAVTGSLVPALPVAPVFGVLLGAALLAWLATMAPTRGSMRTRPIDAIGIRE